MADTIDGNAFRTLSCGLYVISSVTNDGKFEGCVANTTLQVSSNPAQLLIALNKENATTQAILESRKFCVNVLTTDTTMDLIGLFGFQSGKEVDKFAQINHGVNDFGLPYLESCVCARFSVEVDSTVDVTTHIVFIGKVEEAVTVSDAEPLTYKYYHEVLRGKTPPKAPSYSAQIDAPEPDAAKAELPLLAEIGELEKQIPVSSEAPKIGWRCTMCGHIVEGYPDGLPENFHCPICGMGREFFELVYL